MSATSKAIIEASRDSDLRDRASALCVEGAMHEDPRYFVDSHMIQFACAPINNNGDTVASMYEYAARQYQIKRAELVKQLEELDANRVGNDMSKVTDEHIRFALNKIITEYGGAG